MNNSPIILGVNGIRTDGRATTDLLLKDLADSGFRTVDLNYPRINLFTARCRSRQRAAGKRLAQFDHPGDAVIAHSYGALVVLRAMEAGAQFGMVFLFAPALDSHVYFPAEGATHIHIIHNQADRAIGLGALLWRHDFGRMGQHGYNGPPDFRITNVPTYDDHAQHGPLHHSDYFLPAERRRWTDYIKRHIRIQYG
jgi:hypothetical protein